MSYIRATSEPHWEDIGTGWYVYGSHDRIENLPAGFRPFIEVVMRMLDQSGQFTDDELEYIHAALRYRLHMNVAEAGRRDTDCRRCGNGD